MTRLLLLAGFVVGVASCTDQPGGTPEPPRPTGLQVLAPLSTDGVRASLVQTDGDALLVRVEARGVALGSVQGSLTFDPGDFEVLEATGLPGAQVVINVAGAAGGTVRFAAFEASGIPSGDLIRLRVKVRRALSSARATIRLEVAGSVEGLPLVPAQLLGTDGVYGVPR